MAAEQSTMPDRSSWWRWCRDVRSRFEPAESDYPTRTGVINAYHLVAALSELTTSEHVVVCGDATACIVPFQLMQVRDGMRLFSNSGCASMGYDLPASLGAAVASPGRRVVALAGDGSVMMNLQELETLKNWGLDILLVILDNGGYLSIKQTQSNFFQREFGASPASGISFPDFRRVAEAFGLGVVRLEPEGNWRQQLAEIVSATGPRVCVAPLDTRQEFEPRLRSRMVDGVIRTPSLDDMYPHLPDDLIAEVRRTGRRG
jgi:acetolactate synthase I/II/III large subunit